MNGSDVSKRSNFIRMVLSSVLLLVALIYKRTGLSYIFLHKLLKIIQSSVPNRAILIIEDFEPKSICDHLSNNKLKLNFVHYIYHKK